MEMDIAVVGVGSFVTLDGDRVKEVRICLGAVAPIPLRARHAEEVLRGQVPTAEAIVHAGQTAADEARPISDQRGSAEFRRHLVDVLTQRTLTRAIELARQS
jgi:carbon-monoxide dehydrogenase medium subunit